MAKVSDVFKYAPPGNGWLKLHFPGQAGVYSNFNGYKQMITSGSNAYKDVATWLILAPLNLGIGGIAKGIL